MDRRTQKVMIMIGALHPRLNIGGVYLKRCEGGKAFLGVIECVLAETKNLSEYIKANERANVKGCEEGKHFARRGDKGIISEENAWWEN